MSCLATSGAYFMPSRDIYCYKKPISWHGENLVIEWQSSECSKNTENEFESKMSINSYL